jgi:YHS domain-containing protein
LNPFAINRPIFIHKVHIWGLGYERSRPDILSGSHSSAKAPAGLKARALQRPCAMSRGIHLIDSSSTVIKGSHSLRKRILSLSLSKTLLLPGPDVAIGAGSFTEYSVKLSKPNHPRKDFIMVKDLVCGMDVDPKTAINKSEYNGKMYYFCSPGCKKDFDKEPEKYIMKEEQTQHHH